MDCDGFSGAAIAGVARAAASRALERAVEQISGNAEYSSDTNGAEKTSIMDCLVTQDDFYEAILDVRESMGTHDHTEDDVESDNNDDDDDTSGEK